MHKGKQVYKSFNSPSSQSIIATGYLWEAYNHFIISYSTIEHRLLCLSPSCSVRYLFWKMSGIVRQQQKTDYGETLEKGGTFRLLFFCPTMFFQMPRMTKVAHIYDSSLNFLGLLHYKEHIKSLSLARLQSLSCTWDNSHKHFLYFSIKPSVPISTSALFSKDRV